jgi:PTH1 family peptidyl-tRNA hydrolase
MSANKIKLVAALGNPGNEYVFTRHNIAWQFLEYLSFYNQLNWTTKFNSEYSTIAIDDEKVFFIRPQTYMNRSGDGILALLNYFKLSTDDLIIIHDELELDFGTISLKNGGGLAGHNGLRSIVVNLGTRDFLRFRLGISKPSKGGDITNYVLGGFNSSQKDLLPQYFEKSAEIFESILENGFKNYEKKYKKFKTF